MVKTTSEFLDPVGSRLKRRELTFGLREAIVISVLGVAIASVAAYHFVSEPPSRSGATSASNR